MDAGSFLRILSGEANMKQKIIAAATCIALIAAIGWAISKARSLKPNESVNNGYTQEFTMPSPELRTKMESAWKNRDTSQDRAMMDPSTRGKRQEEFMDQLPAGEQIEMRDMMKRMEQQRERVQAVLSPEEQRVMMQKFMGMMRRNRGGMMGSRNSEGGDKPAEAPAPESK